MSRAIPIMHPETRAIMRYRSESFCRYCKKVVEATDGACPHCERGGINEIEDGRLCPQCLKGNLVLTKLIVL